MHALNLTWRCKVWPLAEGIAFFPTTLENQIFAVHGHSPPPHPHLHLGILKISVAGEILALSYWAVSSTGTAAAAWFASSEHQRDAMAKDPQECR